MIAKLRDMTMSRDGREWIITLSTPTDFSEQFDELSKAEVDVEIKKHRNRRSLDANGFAWVLIDKIAEKMGLSKTEVYRNAIRDIGGVCDYICVKNEAVDRLINGWHKNGIGWQTEKMASRIPGCTNVVLYYGSSVYDTKQMSHLIDNLIQDAEALGIPTIKDDTEREKMLQKWARKGE